MNQMILTENLSGQDILNIRNRSEIIIYEYKDGYSINKKTHEHVSFETKR